MEFHKEMPLFVSLCGLVAVMIAAGLAFYAVALEYASRMVGA